MDYFLQQTLPKKLNFGSYPPSPVLDTNIKVTSAVFSKTYHHKRAQNNGIQTRRTAITVSRKLQIYF